jgi:acetyl esterase/lipase
MRRITFTAGRGVLRHWAAAVLLLAVCSGGLLAQERERQGRNSLRRGSPESAEPGNAEPRRRRPSEMPAPDHANVAYGEHERNVLDLWLAESEEPAPLMIYIHGGGFRGGDKNTLSPQVLASCLEAGISVAAINYRLTNVAPFPAAHHDSARALQFLRSKSDEWNLDKSRVAATGGSAGGGISLWLAFHDDLAEPDSDDPVARESTRLQCVAVSGAQPSYDPRFFREIGLPRLEQHAFFYPFYGITPEEFDSDKAHQLYDEAAAITHLTAEDQVPVLMVYSGGDVPITDETSLGVIVHHPKLGLALKERMDELGLTCIVTYPDQPEPRGRVSVLEFLKQHLQVAGAD